MKIRKRYVVLALVATMVIYFLIPKGPRSGHVLDEAMRAGLTAAAFNPIARVDMAHDYFHDMDRGVTLEPKVK
jgi:hypothetical protein